MAWYLGIAAWETAEEHSLCDVLEGGSWEAEPLAEYNLKNHDATALYL